MFWFQLEDAWALLGQTWIDIANPINDPGGEIFVRMSGTGAFSGSASNVSAYTYSEGSTPLIPGDESGAIGDVSIDVLDCNNSSILLYKDEFFLRDSLHGSVVGNIENISSSNQLITMGGRTRLAFLNVDRILEPRSGSIEAVMNYILDVAGIGGNVVYDESLPTTVIRTPGYEGDLWVFVKDLASAHDFEVTVIRNFVVVRPVRQRLIDNTNLIDENWQVEDIELAREFDVAYYNYSQETDFLVYPKGGFDPELAVYQVEANETVEFEVELEFYLTSVKQPTPLDIVPKDYTGIESVYSVSANDNLPVSAAFWNDFGGDVEFEILGRGDRLKITITGPDFPELSPYSISVSDGSTSYSTLRVIGDGMNFVREIHTERTGLSASDTPNEKGAEIDNTAIDTLEDAKRYALLGRRLYALPRQTFSTSSRTFDRLEGSIPFFFYPSFLDFSSSLSPNYSFDSFNSQYGGITFEEFTVQLLNTVQQGFGEVSGSRIQLRDAMYRVRNVTITSDIISIDTEYDTLFGDLQRAFTPEKTFNNFNEIFEGTVFRDYALLPLRQTKCLL